MVRANNRTVRRLDGGISIESADPAGGAVSSGAERGDRLEDAALLRGEGRFADDLPIAPGTLEAAILRSPYAHARLVSIDAAAAEALDGVRCVLTGADIGRWSDPFAVGVRQPMEHRCLATDRVRYAGEPVAVVVADSRALAERAAGSVRVEYEPLQAIVDPVAATSDGAPVLHPDMGSNVPSDRRFRYGDPERAFAEAAHRVSLDVRFPRSFCTPIECFVVLARFDPAAVAYDVTANFQGPYALHSVMARALRVPANRLRLRTPPDSGGSFGIKQAVFPHVVLMALAARKAGAPVKWVEDRLEHLQAASSATNRVTTIEAAVAADGRITALRYDQLDDCGAYLRAPEPATFYRMHGALSGAYAIEHLAVRNRVVLTNKTPSGLSRGFGGPQVYFALERLVQRIAVRLDLDPLDVIRCNLVPSGRFPYRATAGALYDSGDYPASVRQACEEGDLDALLERRRSAREAGRLYGIGFAAVVEPSVSNMGYVTMAYTAAERERAGPKNGATSTASVSLDPLGGVNVHIDSTPQGQGHRTVAARIVADAFGLTSESIVVDAELDTGKDPWSIASGNYSSRFAGAAAGAVHLAAVRLRERIARIAAKVLDADADALTFADGRIAVGDDPARSVSFRRIVGMAHWSPALLPAGESGAFRETAFWTPPELEPPDGEDRVNTSLCYGFIFDFCGVEIDRITGAVTIDRYVTLHDAGTILDRRSLDGQVRGAFAQGLGAALMEELGYADDGTFLAPTLADYLIPTATEVPEPLILHRETPSPFTPLGAKGAGEGNNMSTPVCVANAVADALGKADIVLPLTPCRVRTLIGIDEPPPPPDLARPARAGTSAGSGTRSGAGGPDGAGDAADAEPTLRASGSVELPAPPEEVFRRLLEPATLRVIIPRCEALTATGEHAYTATVSVGVGPIKARFESRVELSELQPPESLRLAGRGTSVMGDAQGGADVRLHALENGRTRLDYDYSAHVNGRVASVGARMLDGASRVVVEQIFARLADELNGDAEGTPGAGGAGGGPLGRAVRWLGRRLGVSA